MTYKFSCRTRAANIEELGRLQEQLKKDGRDIAVDYILAVPAARYGDFADDLKNLHKTQDNTQEWCAETKWQSSRLVVAHDPVVAARRTAARDKTIEELLKLSQQCSGKLDDQDEMVGQAIADGARQDRACEVISLSERTLQRWQRDQSRGDLRPVRVQQPKNALSAQERQAVLAVAHSEEFGHLCPSQIVPRLADQGKYIASESTFHRLLKAENQLQHRGAERPPIKRSKPRALVATAPRQLFS